MLPIYRKNFGGKVIFFVLHLGLGNTSMDILAGSQKIAFESVCFLFSKISKKRKKLRQNRAGKRRKVSGNRSKDLYFAFLSITSP